MRHQEGGTSISEQDYRIGAPVYVRGVVASKRLSVPLKNGHLFNGIQVKVKGYKDPLYVYGSEVIPRESPRLYLTDTDFEVNRTVFQKNLRSYRRAKHLTQEQLGRSIGSPASSVVNWEKGRCLPRLRTLMELSKHMGVTMEDLCQKELTF